MNLKINLPGQALEGEGRHQGNFTRREVLEPFSRDEDLESSWELFDERSVTFVKLQDEITYVDMYGFEPMDPVEVTPVVSTPPASKKRGRPKGSKDSRPRKKKSTLVDIDAAVAWCELSLTEFGRSQREHVEQEVVSTIEVEPVAPLETELPPPSMVSPDVPKLREVAEPQVMPEVVEVVKPEPVTPALPKLSFGKFKMGGGKS